MFQTGERCELEDPGGAWGTGQAGVVGARHGAARCEQRLEGGAGWTGKGPGSTGTSVFLCCKSNGKTLKDFKIIYFEIIRDLQEVAEVLNREVLCPPPASSSGYVSVPGQHQNWEMHFVSERVGLCIFTLHADSCSHLRCQDTVLPCSCPPPRLTLISAPSL